MHPLRWMHFFILSTMNKFLIVGLGNIGPEYAHTRHNIGFDILDMLVKKHGGVFQSDRLADTAEIRLKNKILLCIKPTTYVNLSGKAVKYWMEKEKIPLSQVLVLIDELALPLDRMRLRGSGSDGGHNGLKSIQEQLGTTEYARLRFGIGNNYPKGRQADFVLSAWKAEEWPLVLHKIGKSVELIEQFALAGLNTAMNQFNNVIYQL
jgi:PTH1 family peptidyl-tRNA hydrolase